MAAPDVSSLVIVSTTNEPSDFSVALRETFPTTSLTKTLTESGFFLQCSNSIEAVLKGLWKVLSFMVFEGLDACNRVRWVINDFVTLGGEALHSRGRQKALSNCQAIHNIKKLSLNNDNSKTEPILYPVHLPLSHILFFFIFCVLMYLVLSFCKTKVNLWPTLTNVLSTVHPRLFICSCEQSIKQIAQNRSIRVVLRKSGRRQAY